MKNNIAAAELQLSAWRLAVGIAARENLVSRNPARRRAPALCDLYARLAALLHRGASLLSPSTCAPELLGAAGWALSLAVFLDGDAIGIDAFNQRIAIADPEHPIAPRYVH